MSLDRLIQASFKRLSTSLSSLSEEKKTVSLALKDETIIELSTMIHNFAKRPTFSLVLKHFCELLISFEYEPATLVTVLKIMSDHCKIVFDTCLAASIDVERETLDRIIPTLLSVKSAYLSRAVVSAYLNLPTYDPIIGIQAQLHANREGSCDKYIEDIFLFLSTVCGWAYFDSVKAHLFLLLSTDRPADSRDLIHTLAESKRKYSCLELFSLMNLQKASIPQFYDQVSEIILFLRSQDSPLLIQALAHFASKPILRWCQLNPQDFAENSLKCGSCGKFFELVLPMTSKNKGDISPSADALNLRTLLSMIAVNSEVLNKFDRYVARKTGALSSHQDQEILTSLELKMFSVLMKLVNVDKHFVVRDAHRLLIAFNSLLIPAAWVRCAFPNHPLVSFCEKYLDFVLSKISTVCNFLTSSSADLALVEVEKISFWSSAFMIEPNVITPILSSHLSHFDRNLLYRSYMYICALKTAQEIPGGNSYLAKYYMNPSNFERAIVQGYWISDLIVDTKDQQDFFLNNFSPYVADTSNSSLLEEPSRRILDTFIKILQYPSGRSSEESVIENSADKIAHKKEYIGSIEASVFPCDPGIFNSMGYLCRQIYEVSTQFNSFDTEMLGTSDPLYVEDKLAEEDPEHFYKAMDELTMRGPFFLPVLSKCIPDCQYGVRESSVKFFFSFASCSRFRQDSLTFLFSQNLPLIMKWSNLLIQDCFWDVNRNLHQIESLNEYICMFFSIFIPGNILDSFLGNDTDLTSIRAETYLNFARQCEKIFYIFLCSASGTIFNFLRKTTKLMYEFFSKPHPINSIIDSNFTWSLMKAVIDDRGPVIRSQKFFQKKIFAFLHNHVEKQTDGLRDAAAVAWEQFKKLSPSDDLSKADLKVFSNYGTFLSIVWGIGISLEVYDANIATRNTPTVTFVSALVDSLTSSNIQKRIIAEQIISRDLHPRLCFLVYGRLHEDFKSIAKSGRTSILSKSEKDTVVEYCTVMEKLIKRLPGVILFQISWYQLEVCEFLTNVIVQQHKLMDSNETISSDDLDTQLLAYGKTNLSALRYVGMVLSYAEKSRTGSSFFYFKNEVFKSLIYLLEVAFFKEENSYLMASHIRTSANVSSVFKEIIIELTFCLSKCSERLPIIRRNLNYDSEVRIFRNIMFGNYYNVILRILKKCLADAKEIEFQESIQSQYVGGSKSNEFSKAELAKLTQYAMTTLGNLVKSNYEIGAAYILPLIIDESPVIKRTFLQIFKYIFEGSIAAKWEGLDPTSEYLFEATSSGFTHEDFITAVRNTVPAHQIDRVSRALFSMLKKCRKVQHSLEYLLKYELQVSLKPLDILRRNNLTTKFLSLIGKEFGEGYLGKTIGRVLNEIIVNEDYFEMTPFYQSPDGISSEDSAKFFHYLSLLVDSVCSSIDEVPPILRATCRTLRKTVFECTGDDQVSIMVVTTYFFLRFLCPAITTPEESAIIDFEPTPEANRSFVLLAKALQNASNGNLNIERFPLLKGKELEMHGLVNRIARFLDVLSGVDIDIEKAEPFGARRFEREEFMVLQTYLVEMAHQIRHEFTSMNVKCILPVERRYDAFKTYSSYFHYVGINCLVLYPDVSTFVKNNKNRYIELYDTIKESLTNPASPQITASKFFYESVAKDGTQVFVMTLVELDSLEVDPKILFSRVIQSISRSSTSTYYVIFDCTLFNKSSLGPIAIEMIDMLVRLMPDELTDMCTRIFYVNVSSVFSPSLTRRLEKRAVSKFKFLNPNNLKFIFLSTLEDSKIIDDFNLSKWHSIVSSSGKDFVGNVSYIQTDSNGSKSFPVYLRLTGCFAIYSIGESKRVKIGRFSKNFKVVNFEPLQDWQDMREVASKSPSSLNAANFSVYSSLLEQTLMFYSDKQVEIICMFYLNLGGYQLNLENQRKFLSIDSSPVSTKDLLGDVFFSIGLGLLSDDSSVRRNAFDLYQEFEIYLNSKKKVNHNIFELGTAFSPLKSSLMVSSLSNKVARLYPELTKQVVVAFNTIVANTEVKVASYDLFLIVEPWVEHLYSRVFLSDDVDGPELTRTFIAAIVKSIPSKQTDLSRVNDQVWAKLVSEALLVPTLVNEVVKEGLNRQFTGVDDDNLISLMSLNPDMKMCSTILNHLIEGAKIPRSLSGQEARTQLYWTRVATLLRICVPLFFNQILFVEKFLAQITFILAIFHQSGTLEIRNLLQQLSVNIMNTLASNKYLGNYSSRMLEDFPSLSERQASGVFGLTLDPDSRPKLGEQAAHENPYEYHKEYYSLRLYYERLIYPLSLPDYRLANVSNIWTSQLMILSTKFMRNDDYCLQWRAGVFLAYLSTLGVPDVAISDYLSKVVDFWERVATPSDFSTFAYLALGLCRVCEGMQYSTAYVPILLWLGLTLTRYDNQLLYEVGFGMFVRIFTTVSSRGFLEKQRIWDYLTDQTKLASHVVGKFLKKEDLIFLLEAESFVVHSIAKLLVHPLTREDDTRISREIMVIRIDSEFKQVRNCGELFSLDAIYGVIPIYLMLGHEEAQRVLIEGGITGVDLEEIMIGRNSCPRILLKALLEHRKIQKATLITMCQIFCFKASDIYIRTRCLALLLEAGKSDQYIIEFIYPLINDFCVKLCSEHSGPEMIALIFEVQFMAASIFSKQKSFNPLYKEFLEELSITMDTFKLDFKYSGFADHPVKEFQSSRLTSMMIGGIKYNESLARYKH